MFTTSHPSPLLDYLRVPARTLDVQSRSRVVEIATSDGRSVSWPLDDAPGSAPERRVRDVRVFAETLGDEDVRALLPDGDWTGADEVLDAAGEPVAHLWRSSDGSVFLPFSADAAMVNLWSEAYQAGARSAGVKRLALK